MPVPITSLYTSVLGFYFVALSGRVISLRRSKRIALGDGLVDVVRELVTKKGEVTDADVGEALKKYSDLSKAIRSHGNFAEYIPYLLISLGFAELNGAPAKLLHGFGAIILFSRLMHSEFGMQKARALGIGRPVGTVLTLLSFIGLGATNLYLSFA